MPNFALITGVVTGAPTIDQIQSHIKSNSLPIFRAPIDSGCTASCTDTLARLVNVRPCDEDFKAANGSMCKCTAIGDMPILAKDSTGKIFRFVFTNVRYVPEFKYTLISVKQIWRDQGIKSLFADSGRLMFPDGNSLPYDPRFKLYAITLISEPMLINSLGAIENEKSKTKTSNGNTCCVGFHNVKSTSHVARLPAAQASELLHRRCHMGVNKVRALPHVSGDAPKILGSAIPCTCVYCAAAQIRRAGHSGAMDTPDPEPGILHVDLKGPFPLSVTGKFRYAAFFIDEYSRFVFVEFLHDKSEVIEATKRSMAKFNSLVGTSVDENGIASPRPKVRRLHRDHEGGLESKQFEAFRAHELIYSTTSAPHDHDLNPIAESTINVISTLSTSYKSQSGAPIGFWPEILRYAVDWHNAVPQGSVGSSTSDPQISPYQRFTLKLPKVMDLCAIGSRAVVLKPPTHQSKTTLAARGWVGMFLGRSSDAIGTWEVWVPSINRKVRSSSLTIDEEFFPWHGSNAHQPLVSATTSARFFSDHLGPTIQTDSQLSPTEFVRPSDINENPRPSLSFLNLFSGPYQHHREGGLSKALRAFGWDSVTDFDNDRDLGGGWQDDLLNDSRYTLSYSIRLARVHSTLSTVPSLVSLPQWPGASMHPARGVAVVLSQCAALNIPTDFRVFRRNTNASYSTQIAFLTARSRFLLLRTSHPVVLPFASKAPPIAAYLARPSTWQMCLTALFSPRRSSSASRRRSLGRPWLLLRTADSTRPPRSTLQSGIPTTRRPSSIS